MSNLHSKSGIETYNECRRKYRYQYVDGYESVNDGTRESRMGNFGHSLVEQRWGGKPAAGDYGLEAVDAARIVALIDNAPESHTKPPEGLAGVEVPFTVDRLGIRGFYDGLCKLPHNVAQIWEHKFTSSDHSVDPIYWQRTTTDWQVGLYQLAALEEYDEVEVIYNVFRVPQHRQGKSESVADFAERIEGEIGANPGRYYGQARVKWSAESLARIEHDLLDWQSELAHNQATGCWPRSRKCWEWRRPCAFQPVCFRGEELSNERLYKVRTRR